MINDHANRERVRASILEKYSKVASRAQGQFRYPVGEAGLEGLGYNTEWYAHISLEIRACFCGVGNPFGMGAPSLGERVLDVGCGCGVDVLVAARLCGPEGFAAGVEFSPEMAARARANARASGTANAGIARGAAEELPFEDARFDRVFSSGVYNLVVDKPRALREAWRVLRPGGRLQVADQMLTGPPPLSEEEALGSWFR